MIKEKNRPTYKRQRFLLSFIRQLRTSVTAIELQKLVFLYHMQERESFYDFVPYKYGPYSFQLAEDVKTLRIDNYLSVDQGIKPIGNYQSKSFFSIAPERGNSLVRKAYREYPYYSINSEIMPTLFNRNEVELFQCEKQKYIRTEQVLFTIGYEGQSIEAFINTLIRNDIRVLCDVRRNPLSRKFGFSKRNLSYTMESIGIKYVHIPELGIDSADRSTLTTAYDYQILFEAYAKSLPRCKMQLGQLYSLLCACDRIALMCYERDPKMCHRHVIRDYLTDNQSIKYVDL